eukprot:7704028-Karenia_brevis.AAC.1
MLASSSNEVRLGGQWLIVIIDETYWSRRKCSKGGIKGRGSLGHKVRVIAETGRVRLIQIAGPRRPLIEEQIKKHVTSGSVNFTESHHSYCWLKEAGYVHRSVKHEAHKFSRQRVSGVSINVTRNASEGFFG